MKKIITIILLFTGLNSFAQKSLQDLKFSEIKETENIKWSEIMGGITSFPKPDSVIQNGKKYTMYFFDFNAKTVVKEKFYNAYKVLAKKSYKDIALERQQQSYIRRDKARNQSW